MARNWDDLLQRDFKAITFPRAFAIFALNSMALYTVFTWTRLLLPVGRFGIRKISQTSFYHNFGPVGVAGALGLLFAGKLKKIFSWLFRVQNVQIHPPQILPTRDHAG